MALTLRRRGPSETHVYKIGWAEVGLIVSLFRQGGCLVDS